MRNLFLVLILTSGVWGLSTALVHAQATEDATETRTPTEVVLRLEEVTVTATKTKRDTLTTPGEVSVLTQEYFQQRQAQSLDDVLRYEPGVDSSGGPRTMGEGPNIRGMSGDRVLTLLDGVRLNFQSGHTGRLFIDMEQLKRVEVIRGPGSALYGSQALGGSWPWRPGTHPTFWLRTCNTAFGKNSATSTPMKNFSLPPPYLAASPTKSKS